MSFAIFNFDYYGIGDVRPGTAIGYTSGDGQNFFHMPASIANQVNTTVGNTGIVGQWVFRSDGGECVCTSYTWLLLTKTRDRGQ